jgi:ureidoglycolate hydrolase
VIRKISPNNFRRYGWIIAHPRKNSHGKRKNLFHVVVRETGSCGWRIAFLIVRDKAIDRMERHPGTFESFEPVSGRSILYLASDKNPKAIAAFSLDRPVILKKDIWHGVVTLGKESEIKITENARVKSVYWRLGYTVNHR